jgi:hypothetical protein
MKGIDGELEEMIIHLKHDVKPVKKIPCADRLTIEIMQVGETTLIRIL